MELTPQQVNDFIAKAILESQIGAVVQESVKRAVADLSKSYNNPFDSVIKNEVASLIQKHVREVFGPQLEAGVKEALAKNVTADMCSAIVTAAFEKFRRNNDY